MQQSTRTPGSRPLVGLVTAFVSALFAFVSFSMGLVVAEQVIVPAAILLTSLVAAVIASWAAGVRSGIHPPINQLVIRNLAWAIVPALLLLPIGRAADRMGVVTPPAFMYAAVLICIARQLRRGSPFASGLPRAR